MKNPYRILDLPQNATKKEIARSLIFAQKKNIKTKKYKPQELMLAQKQLLNPSKRLAADFVYPAKYKTKRPRKLKPTFELENLDLSTINLNEFNSLNQF